MNFYFGFVSFFYKNLSFVYNLFINKSAYKNVSKISGAFIFSKYNIVGNGNKVHLTNGMKKSSIVISGTDNIVKSYDCEIDKSLMTIEGKNNSIILSKGVKLRNSIITIRGDNSIIFVGQNTTFGGARLINVGNANSLKVGEGCLFSDHIEIWASDTHPIYDSDGKLINVDRPITIGNSVWIGSRVIILKGVTIGDGSVIGMGSVVTRDVPPASISVGTPNRTIKSGITWSLKRTDL